MTRRLSLRIISLPYLNKLFEISNVNVGRSNRLTRFPTLVWMSGLSPVIPSE